MRALDHALDLCRRNGSRFGGFFQIKQIFDVPFRAFDRRKSQRERRKAEPGNGGNDRGDDLEMGLFFADDAVFAYFFAPRLELN